MTMSDLKELLSELDFEQWLDMEGIIYRRGGVSARGREVNIKECPVCGSTNWKVYFNLTNNVGKCFAGDHPEEIQFNKLVFLKHYSGKSRRAFEEYVHNALLSQGWAPKKEEVVLASAVELEGPVALPRHYELPIDGRLPVTVGCRTILLSGTLPRSWPNTLTCVTASRENMLMSTHIPIRLKGRHSICAS